MYANMEKEISNLIMSHPSQDTTNEMPPLVPDLCLVLWWVTPQKVPRSIVTALIKNTVIHRKLWNDTQDIQQIGNSGYLWGEN